MSIQEIAYCLNFSNQSFFGKYFKNHTGQTPSAYRMGGGAADAVSGCTSSKEGTGEQHGCVVIKDNVVLLFKGRQAFSLKNVRQTEVENNVILGG